MPLAERVPLAGLFFIMMELELLDTRDISCFLATREKQNNQGAKWLLPLVKGFGEFK